MLSFTIAVPEMRTASHDIVQPPGGTTTTSPGTSSLLLTSTSTVNKMINKPTCLWWYLSLSWTPQIFAASLHFLGTLHYQLHISIHLHLHLQLCLISISPCKCWTTMVTLASHTHTKKKGYTQLTSQFSLCEGPDPLYTTYSQVIPCKYRPYLYEGYTATHCYGIKFCIITIG